MEVGLHFLNGRKTGGYVTWGVPWKKGDVHKGDVFSVTDENGNMPAVDTEPCAYWPDGSLKWTSHTAKIGTRNFVLSKSENTPAPDILVNIR